MIVTVTEMMSYDRCPRKWWLSSLNRQRLTPLKPQEPLETGSLVHGAGERWIRLYSQDPTYTFKQHLMDVATERLRILTTIYETATGRVPPTTVLDDYYGWVNLAAAMCENYQNYYKTPLPRDYVLVQPEQQVVIAIPNTEHCECGEKCAHDCPVCYQRPYKHICECMVLRPDDSSTAWENPNLCKCVEPHYYEGTLDAIIADTRDWHFVYERKTYGQRPNVTHLQRDFQFLSYDWILHQSTDKAHGICYDGMWKRAIPPAGKKEGDLFFRYIMSRTDSERDELERHLTETVLEMAARPTDLPPKRIVPAPKGCIDCLGLIDACDSISEETSFPRAQYVLRDLTPAFVAFYGRHGG